MHLLLNSTRTSHNLVAIILIQSAVSNSTLSTVDGKVSVSPGLRNTIGMLLVSKTLQ